MKKQSRHLAEKVSLIRWISSASTSSPGLGIRSSGDRGSSVITEDSRGLLDGVVCLLPDGVGVPLSAGVADGVALLESAGTGLGFLTDSGLDEPAPSSVVAFRLTVCWLFVFVCRSLLSTLTAFFSFTNRLATFVLDTLSSMKIDAGLTTSGSTHVSFA